MTNKMIRLFILMMLVINPLAAQTTGDYVMTDITNNTELWNDNLSLAKGSFTTIDTLTSVENYSIWGLDVAIIVTSAGERIIITDPDINLEFQPWELLTALYRFEGDVSIKSDRVFKIATHVEIEYLGDKE